MRHLYLLRHAKSDWDDPALSDHARTLNDRGRRAAATIGAYLAQGQIAPQAVLVSSARRTRQTFDLLALTPRPAIVAPMDELYLAEPGRILAILHGVDPAISSVMVIGHNPGIHTLAMTLAEDEPQTVPLNAPAGRSAHDTRLARLAGGFPTGALAEFSLSGPWCDLAPGGATLTRLTTPYDLPEMAR